MSKKLKTQLNEIIKIKHKFGVIERLKIACAIGAYVFGFLSNVKEQEKVYRLSKLRREPFSKTVRRIIQTGLQLVPTKLDMLDFAYGDNDLIKCVERVSKDTFKITTSNGLVFYDWESSKKHYMMYWLMRDKAKKMYTQDTFFAGSAVNRSYVHGTSRFPGDAYLPTEGGTIVEAGSYVGYKAVSFAQRVGETGRVLVLEASPDNYRLLQKNLKENRLDDVATPMHCAVWNENKEVKLTSKRRMQHTVAETDELHFEGSSMVQARTLDSLFEEFSLCHVDFLNLQLNGAEIEAIEGLQEHFNDVKIINIITKYSRNGDLVVDLAKKMLTERGCKVLVDSRDGGLYNLTVEVNPG